MNRFRTHLSLALVCLVSGCGKADVGPANKATVKVTGFVTVNGAAPPWKVQLEARAEGGMDGKQPTVTFAETEEDGSFQFSTYVFGDGVPEGSYVILAKSQDAVQPFSNGADPPDKLGGKFDTPKESVTKLEVKAGSEPVDMGTIDLKATVKKKK